MRKEASDYERAEVDRWSASDHPRGVDWPVRRSCNRSPGSIFAFSSTCSSKAGRGNGPKELRLISLWTPTPPRPGPPPIAHEEKEKTLRQAKQTPAECVAWRAAPTADPRRARHRTEI
ncbi:hypothetical protein LSAT2_020222 [Lamellibrachia satsuma]|nr:hypothetical protein LSAT2_020222 [Lamellibrachia satsuma]